MNGSVSIEVLLVVIAFSAFCIGGAMFFEAADLEVARNQNPRCGNRKRENMLTIVGLTLTVTGVLTMTYIAGHSWENLCNKANQPRIQITHF